MKPKVLAYYLPQFHPTPENDEWWGKGFTEWVNVAKARPLFKGHKQPHIPADLGFYDLRLPESRAMQAEYAKKAGISAFCYWHYWFGNGKRLLNYPLDEVIRLGEPDFPFCLAWANHSWYKKSWVAGNDIFNKATSKLLIEQEYPGEDDIRNHFYTMLPAFKDKRYFKIHGKLAFVIFAPQDLPDPDNFMQIWNDLATKEGLPGFFFIAHTFHVNNINMLRRQNYDAINVSLHRNVMGARDNYHSLMMKIINSIRDRISIKPDIIEYKEAIKQLDSPLFEDEKILPTIIPNWDHTPRSGNFGRVFTNSTPELFQKHVHQIFSRIANKKDEDKIVFIKSWNEWGEGNYLEPDIEFGTAFLDALKNEINKL